MTGVLVRKETCGHSMRRSHVATEAEVGAMRLQAKEWQGGQESPRAGGSQRVTLEPSEGVQSVP